jgi:lysophospholipase L1-like esterase
MVIGDSLVWGYDMEAEDRFTDILRRQLPDVRIVNAGVPGYGTDQEYLLLQRIWGAIKPDIVLLVFCVSNDRADNTSNTRYGGYLKPYFERSEDGQWHVIGQPVPWSRFAYFNESPFVHRVWLARLAAAAYVQIRHPEIAVPDPTEALVGMMRTFTEAHSALFLVGLQNHDSELEAFLQAEDIRYMTFDGAGVIDGTHWSPRGHALVAKRVRALLEAAGAIKTVQPAVSDNR